MEHRKKTESRYRDEVIALDEYEKASKRINLNLNFDEIKTKKDYYEALLNYANSTDKPEVIKNLMHTRKGSTGSGFFKLWESQDTKDNIEMGITKKENRTKTVNVDSPNKSEIDKIEITERYKLYDQFVRERDGEFLIWLKKHKKNQ